MIKFAVIARIKPEHRDDFLRALNNYLPFVSKEADTVQYDICQGDSDPNMFLFYEAYPHEEAVKAHQNSPAFESYIEEIKPYLAEPPVSMKGIMGAR